MAIPAVALAAAALTARAQVSLTTVVELAQKNSASVQLAIADVNKAASQLSESKDAFVPSISFGSGLPAFREIGFTGSLPTIWDGSVQSMVFSLPQLKYIQAARAGLESAQLNLKDAKEQVALDASTAYVEMDVVTSELNAVHEQEQDADRLVTIEQQRTDAGVDPTASLLQAKLTAAQLKLSRLHLEARSATLAEQLATLTGLPIGSVVPDHSSIPEIPAVTARESAISTPGLDAAAQQARAKALIAKGDRERLWLLPEIGFGAQYNRNTTLLNSIGQYFVTPGNTGVLPANNFSSGFSIRVHLFDLGLRAKSRESAADALRAKVEAEQAQQQDDVEIVQLNASIRELEAEAEVASLKQQIAEQQLTSVTAQLESGNGAAGTPGAPPQLSPTAEEQARIDERQKYVEALDSGIDLSKARLDLLRALGHMQDWLNELHTK
ncbi:MAG TPA: TolC family protein [Terracidiphilus sp.]|nr:TolC family protein [Terracidiphilus sp.]